MMLSAIFMTVHEHLDIFLSSVFLGEKFFGHKGHDQIYVEKMV